MTESDRYQKLYKRAAWERIRRMHLRLHPTCEKCEERKIIVAAEVVHHLEPHKGNLRLFYFGKLQSLCKPCHDGLIQQTEKSGFYRDIGIDGWPLDKNHPVYAKK